MVVGAMGNTASTPQASCGHISIVRSILSASPCAVPVSSHMDWCLSELRIRKFRGRHPNIFHVPICYDFFLRLYTGHWPAGRTSDCGTLAPHSSIKAACYTHPTNSRHALQTQSAHAQTQPGRTPHRICCKANDTQRPCGRTTNATEQHQEQQNTKLTRTHQTRQH